MGYTNSPLATYTKISPNKSHPRNNKIYLFTPHCVVGQLTAKEIANLSHFTKSGGTGASCTYAVGKDGSIAQICPEEDRSWCSSSKTNDNAAITIETASDKTYPYTIRPEALKSLINLIADCCKRNGITKLLWLKTKDATFSYQRKENEGMLTCHRWFANTECPGADLLSKFQYIADEVNKILGTVVDNNIVVNTDTNTNTADTLQYNTGDAVQLTNVKFYNSSTTTVASSTKTGTYYVYSSNVVNKRIRMTNSAANVGKAVTGWVNVSDLPKKANNNATEASANTDTNTNTTKYKNPPFQIKCTKDLDIYSSPYVNSQKKTGGCKVGVYTITEVNGDYGKLKSGAGWVLLNANVTIL